MRSRSRAAVTGADREGGHDQHQVPQNRRVKPGLAFVQAEAALAELESSQSATADAREAETVSSVASGSLAMLSVEALLQAATVVRRVMWST